MFRLTSDIKVYTQAGKTIRFKYAGVKVVTSLHTLTDTCTLTLPRKLKWANQGQNDLSDIIKRNDRIEVSLGYDGENQTVFKGYLKAVKTGTPIVLECENEAWKLKQIQLKNLYYPKLSLKDFVAEWVPDFETVVADVNLGEVRINGETTLAKVFEYFMKHHPLRFFFRDGVFYGTLGHTMLMKDGGVNTVKFKYGRNVISDRLKYTLAEDVKIQVVAKAILKDNTKLEWKEPKKANGAEVRSFLVPGAKSLEEVKQFAKDTLKTYQADKMDGHIMAFGIPHVKKGDIIHYFSDEHHEKNDKQFVADQVIYTFDMGGYRQKIVMGRQMR